MIAKLMRTFLCLSIALLSSMTHGEIFVYSKTYGESFLGNPLEAYRVTNSNYSLNDLNKVLFLSEGVHGNEYLGLTTKLLSENFWNTLNANHPLKKFLNSAGVIFIVPQVNPDGILKHNRFNHDGVDLNRDFSDQKLNQIESYSLIEFIKDEILPFNFKHKISVDLHCCGGKLLQAQDSAISQKTPYITVLKNTESYKVPIQYTHELFNENFKGTLKDYLSSKYSFIAFTFENFEMDNPLREIEDLLERLPFLNP